MSFILLFLPWTIQYFLGRYSMSGALAVALLLSLINLARSRHVMEWVTFLFFALGTLISLFLHDHFFQNVVSLLSSLTLCLISWGSLWLKAPFTLPYAKKRAPQQFWDSPIFWKINTIMTQFFGVLFGLDFILKGMRLLYPELLPYSLFSILLSLTILFFISWFPSWYKKRALTEGAPL